MLFIDYLKFPFNLRLFTVVFFSSGGVHAEFGVGWLTELLMKLSSNNTNEQVDRLQFDWIQGKFVRNL